MTHLNYFFPYNKGTECHEDHLTRAFLVLLKYSNTALRQFYSYVYHQLEKDSIKPLYQVAFSNINFETQVGSLPEVGTYVSVLITNEVITLNQDVFPVERNAIYDGVIEIDEEIVLFIETKPDSCKVWEKQLCPGLKDIPEGAELIRKCVVLEWKEIINALHRVNESSSTSTTEKILIADFFELINTNFDQLNPFNDFSKCHSSSLADKRIIQMLREISVLSDKVKYHSGWGHFIELDFPEIRKIGLILGLDEKDNDNWKDITIAADFGSTVSQARAFYQNIKSYQELEKLQEFDVYCNLHLAFKNQNLVFLKSPEGCQARYFEYWKSDVWANFGGVPKEKLNSEYLNDYEKEGILIYDAEKQDEVDRIIIKKGYQRVNICPAIYAEHNISREDAIKLDKQGKLISHITDRIIEVLSILNQPLDKIIKR